MVAGVNIIRPAFEALNRQPLFAEGPHQSQRNGGFPRAAACARYNDSPIHIRLLTVTLLPLCVYSPEPDHFLLYAWANNNLTENFPWSSWLHFHIMIVGLIIASY
ncbi:hypothetical protein D3C76_1216410 [compost metagenome]